MPWGGWKVYDSDPKLQKNAKNEDGYWHFLYADKDEPNPDANHVHMKYKLGGDPNGILCSIKTDGIRTHSKREMLQRIEKLIKR